MGHRNNGYKICNPHYNFRDWLGKFKCRVYHEERIFSSSFNLLRHSLKEHGPQLTVDKYPEVMSKLECDFLSSEKSYVIENFEKYKDKIPKDSMFYEKYIKVGLASNFRSRMMVVAKHAVSYINPKKSLQSQARGISQQRWWQICWQKHILWLQWITNDWPWKP